MEQNRKSSLANDKQSLFISALIGAGIGIAVTLAFAFLMPLVLLNTSSPNDLVRLSAPLCTVLGGCAGSVISTKLFAEQNLLPSLVCLGLMAAPILLASLFVSGERDFLTSALVLLGLAASSLLTSFVMLRRNTSKKKRVKKLMKRR